MGRNQYTKRTGAKANLCEAGLHPLIKTDYGTTYCPTCKNARQKIAREERYRANLANGRCGVCGGSMNGLSGSYCQSCRRDHAKFRKGSALLS